jgi:hypothetical protein
VGDKGRRGGSKGQCTGGVRRCTEQSPDNISAAQVALASGVATGSGGAGGWPDRWAEGLGDRRCAHFLNPSCALPPPIAGSSFGPQAAPSMASAKDPRSGGRLRADWAMPLEVGWHVTIVRRRRLFDLGVRPCVATAMFPIAGEAAWVTDHCGQPPGSVHVSFTLHGVGWEDARLCQAGVQYLGA